MLERNSSRFSSSRSRFLTSFIAPLPRFSSNPLRSSSSSASPLLNRIPLLYRNDFVLAKPFTFAEKGELYSEGGPGLAFHDTVSFSHVFLIHDNALQWRWKLISDSNKNDKFRYTREKLRLSISRIYIVLFVKKKFKMLLRIKKVCCRK